MAIVLDATQGAANTVTGAMGMEHSQPCSLFCGGRKVNSGILSNCIQKGRLQDVTLMGKQGLLLVSPCPIEGIAHSAYFCCFTGVVSGHQVQPMTCLQQAPTILKWNKTKEILFFLKWENKHAYEGGGQASMSREKERNHTVQEFLA